MVHLAATMLNRFNRKKKDLPLSKAYQHLEALLLSQQMFFSSHDQLLQFLRVRQDKLYQS